MATTGTATLDFGAFPGASDASVAVTGQAGIVSGSLVEAWLRPVATADHSADEHMVETLKVFAGNIVAATGFTIYGFNTNQINEPSPAPRTARTAVLPTAAMTTGPLNNPAASIVQGKSPRIYGQWTIAWVWN